MKRAFSIIALFSMVFSIAAANAGVLVLCSHEDGFGHVISYEAHEEEVHASCVHPHPPREIAEPDHSHADIDCEDIELVDSELEDLSSNTDRAQGKAPAFHLVARFFSSCQIDESLKDASRPPVYRVLRESESRRFARIVQIRC